MASTSIRHIVKDTIVQLLKARPELAGVQVEYGFPADTMEQDCVWFSAVKGMSYTVPAVQAGRLQRDDIFDLTVVLQSGKHGFSPADGETAAAAYLAALENIVADDASLADVDGLVDATISSVDGPVTERTIEGAISFYVVVISCHARYL